MLIKMKKLVLGLVIAGLFFLSFKPALAAKRRPPRGSRRTQPTRRRTSGFSKGAQAKVSFRSDRRALLLSFANFGQAVSVTYSLTYTSNGIPQGVRSTITPETAGGTRELLFGTCSHGVCRYHHNITNARLIIDSKLGSGVIIRKPYRIRV